MCENALEMQYARLVSPRPETNKSLPNGVKMLFQISSSESEFHMQAEVAGQGRAVEGRY